jgi:NADH:ubiquinone reductase (H+-translocating)
MARRVVILGGGFAGIQTAIELSRVTSGDAFDVTLVADQNYFLFTPLLPQVASSTVDPRHIAQPIRDLRAQRSFRFLRGEVERVDLERKQCSTCDVTLDYDYLVVAPGSRADYFGIAGARENTFNFKSLEDAVVLREHVLDMCEHADHSTDAAHRARMLTFVIIGGGYTGVELVTELHDLLFGYVVKHYRGISAQDIRLLVLEASSEVLRGVHPKLAAHSMKRLARKGIDVRTSTAAVRCFEGGVEIRGGETIFSDTVIWTAGVRATSLVESLPGKHDRIGRCVVNEFLQLENYPEVFLAGDSAAATTAPDAPRVAPVAMAQGEIAARNIDHLARGEALESYRYAAKGMLVSLGMNYAVVDLGGIRFSGYFAWLFWNAVHLYKLAGLKKQLQVAIDWTLALLFPRDAMIVRRPRGCRYCDAHSGENKGDAKAAGQ